MSEARLVVAPERLAAGTLALDGDDYHYLIRVRRLGRGDAVVLVDGAGREATARIAEIGPTAALLAVEAPRPAPARAGPALCVLLSLIKGERMEWAIQKLTELGVDELVPVRAARSVVALEGARAAARQVRYQAVARAAAQQCRRPEVPRVGPICGLAEALAASAAELRLVLWEQARAAPLRAALPGVAPASVAVLVGPEGGLTAGEVDAALAAGFVPVGLGPRILRAETAALAVVAVLGHALGDVG